MKVLGIFIILILVIISVTSIYVVVSRRISDYYRYEATPDEKGKRGEAIVAKQLGQNIPDEQYVINDILFSDTKGNSCQIDHVYINKYGIWVIETKNYGGTIYGSSERMQWTQVFNYGANKNKFYNPVKQNVTHIYRLSVYLGVKDVFHNVVCFSDDADLSNVQAENLYTMSKVGEIKKITCDTKLSPYQMQSYYEKLQKLKERGDIELYEHIENIKDAQTKIENGVCPRCGGNLVVRDGKNGKFLGCSNYPRCRFTKNID